MSAEGERVNADGRMLKAKKQATRHSAEFAARRRAIREAGAVAIARCPEHGLHGMRVECYVCGEGVELVAMVGVEERDELRAHNEHLRATLAQMLIFARGNDHVLGLIHDALDWRQEQP